MSRSNDSIVQSASDGIRFCREQIEYNSKNLNQLRHYSIIIDVVAFIFSLLAVTVFMKWVSFVFLDDFIKNKFCNATSTQRGCLENYRNLFTSILAGTPAALIGIRRLFDIPARIAKSANALSEYKSYKTMFENYKEVVSLRSEANDKIDKLFDRDFGNFQNFRDGH